MIVNFHGHIYFSCANIAQAEAVRRAIARALPELTYVGPLISRPIGPHPEPMFEIHIPGALLAHAIETIEQLRQGLSVLIHPVQDNELQAHTELAQWLGQALTLDLKVLSDRN